MILLFTRKNIASANIADRIIETGKFSEAGDGRWSMGSHTLVECDASSILEVPTDFDTEAIIVLSSHKSARGGKMLTVHVPGNWGEAKMGGSPRTLNIAPASLMKILIRNVARQNSSLGWPVFLEADHHGPTSRVPMVFVEIGSTEEEWKNRDAAAAVAEAVLSSLGDSTKYDAVFGVGGGHYSREFTKLALESEFAVGHIAPKYALENLDRELFRQAIEKNVERVKKVMIAKKATNSTQKKRAIALAENAGISYEFI